MHELRRALVGVIFFGLVGYTGVEGRVGSEERATVEEGADVPLGFREVSAEVGIEYVAFPRRTRGRIQLWTDAAKGEAHVRTHYGLVDLELLASR